MKSSWDILKFILKHALYRTPAASLIGHRYTYYFSPAQLAFLCTCVDATKDTDGAIVEVGCYLGQTTVFLNKHMDSSGIEKPYYAIDTFGGFVEEDVEYEVAVRGKVKSDVTKEFFSNSKYFFDKNMVLNSIRRVKSIRADVCAFDFAAIGKVSLALVDVDLYTPVKKAVRHLYKQLEVGGMIVVDDCKANSRFDGALQAYTECVTEYGLVKRIEHQKLGVITKTE